MPGDLVVAIEIQSQQHGIERHRHVEIAADLVHQRLEPFRDRFVRSVFRSTSVERRPAWRLALFSKATTFVLDAKPPGIRYDGIPPVLGSMGLVSFVDLHMQACGGIIDLFNGALGLGFETIISMVNQSTRRGLGVDASGRLTAGCGIRVDDRLHATISTMRCMRGGGMPPKNIIGGACSQFKLKANPEEVEE